MTQIVILCFEPFRKRKVWQNNVTFQFERFNSIGKLLRIRDGFWDICKQPLHLILCFEVELIVGETKPAVASLSYRCGNEVIIVDAKKGIVSFGILFIKIERIVGGNYRDIVFPRKLQKNIVHAFLFFQSVPHQFDVKILSKEIVPPLEGLFGHFLTAVQNQVGHFTQETACRCNKPLPVFFHQFPVNTREFIIVTLYIRQ